MSSFRSTLSIHHITATIFHISIKIIEILTSFCLKEFIDFNIPRCIVIYEYVVNVEDLIIAFSIQGFSTRPYITLGSR